MRRTLVSIMVGVGSGVMACLLMLGGLFVFYPAWLNDLGTEPTPIRPTPLSFWATTPAPDASPTPRPASPTLVPAVNGVCGGPEQMTIALLGVDDRSQNYSSASRTDAITLVNVNFARHSAALLSFPRDLYVPLPNLENQGIVQNRLNTAFEFGEIYKVPGGGPAEFSATMEWNFGLRVDRYVMVNFGAFEAAVDALGGIDVDVPEDIYDAAYPAENGIGTLVFRLPAGQQHMDGRTALRYARTRHQDDDYHRIQRQQLVLLAIRTKVFSPEIIPQIPALVASLGNLAKTDLTPPEMASLACIGPQIDRSAISAQAIDANMVSPWTTEGGAQVSIPNRELITPVINQFLGR
jgi:LCP family protein required for cell wall assembly